MTHVLARLTSALADRYRIDREVGQGGMATVYLAHDVKHDRSVAIKVLKPELGAVLGVERFLSEIKVTANLQHPNLLPLFDSGEAEGLLFYVMPFVEGETLRARIDREKQLPVDEVVRLSVAIAQALDYAHRRGVIHRDLKPENILLADGQPLVADFGIALAVSKAGGQRVTQTGLSLGTPQYMSPEQATGDRAVDARTDIYSLGAMTYEMLTGEPPHSGTTAQAIIARLMTEEVRPLTVLRRSVPAHVDAAVRHALEKLAADRFATAGEFALALQGRGDAATLARYAPAGAGVAAAPGARRAPSAREATAWGIAAMALGLLGLASTRRAAPVEAPVVRAAIVAPRGERLMVGGFPLALSPAGDRIAFVTQGAGGYRTVVRRADELEARTELARGSLRDMAFSPDGRWIAYTEGTEVRRIPSDGGPSEVVGTFSFPLVYGMVWTPDDQLILGTDHGLLAMPARGGVARFVSDSATAGRAIFPALMPDGRTVLARTAVQDDGKVIAIVLATGKVTELGLTAEGVFGVLDDHLIFQGRNGVVSAAPFDSDRLRITGDPVTIMSGVYGAGLSASGAFAYESGTNMRRPVLAGRGEETSLRDVPAAYADPRFSPDGRRVAVSVETDVGSDIWVLDRSAGTFTRMTTEGLNTAAEWTSDGRRILYKSLLNGTVRIMWVPVDGSAPASLLFETAVTLNEAILSPDSRWLVVRSAPGEAPRDIFAVDLTGDRKLVPLVTGPAADIMPRLSPDGRWLAYVSDVSGRAEIYVRPFPGDGARVQVSDAGGSEPLWDRSGRRLFYRTPNGIVAVAVTTGAEFGVGARRLALAIADPPDPTHPSYDVAPDGERFLVLRPAGGQATAMVVYNWQRELREKLRAVSR